MIVRDISETKSVQIQDAEFTIGVIPRGWWRDVSFRMSEGLKKIKPYEGKQLSEIVDEPAFRESNEMLQQVYRDLVKWSVKRHKNLQRSDGQLVSFLTDGDGRMTEELLDTYDLNGLLIPLGVEILKFNTASEQERKNS